MGPRSRDLLETLSDADLSDDGFPFATAVRSPSDMRRHEPPASPMSASWVGSSTFRREFAVGVYEDLMAAGARFGIARGGYYAIDSLRLEKGYRAFGRELTPNDNPVEAGLLFACKLRSRHDFVGRAAVERAKAEGRAGGSSASRSVRTSRCSGAGN